MLHEIRTREGVAEPDWRTRLHRWERRYLDRLGRYNGPDLSRFGLWYQPGHYVPINGRWSAFAAWEWANGCRDLCR